MIAGPAGINLLRTLHMGSTRRRALLYVAARFMMVRIDMCAKRRRSSAEKQALKRA